ncbi:MAG: AMP-binding protein [Phycisphaerae bacterium]|jgi:long-chain-fatty-acid--[acyl-carrier-protein] ligase
MINALLRIWVKLMLSLRYRVRVRGLDAVHRRGDRGILFLPNHPAYIDPIIVMAHLHGDFAPRALADKDQVDRFFIRRLARRMGVRPISDVRTEGPAARAEVKATIAECVEGLRRGENLVLYPSGHVYRTRYEDLRGNSAVETILRQLPDVRVVLVRMRGLWGSSFGLASGHVPNVAQCVRRAAIGLLKSFIFFAPRREVEFELYEPEAFPRSAGRAELNAFLESYYNEDAPPALYVPYTIWERGGVREMPEPDLERRGGDVSSVPEGTRELVRAHLREAAGVETVDDQDRLAEDLGLDSLSKAEIVLWLAQEFGFSVGDVDALVTVADVMLAARGEAVVTRPVELRPPPAKWLADGSPAGVDIPPGRTVAEVFLAQARRSPAKLVVADQTSGAKSYRDIVTAILALRPEIAKLPGEHLGIMLPASVAADVLYMTTLLAGKVPVLVNWTTGTRNMLHALEVTSVERVVTARALVARLASQGVDLSGLTEHLDFLEDIGRRIGRLARLRAWLGAHLSWRSLRAARVPDTAAILVTSGSETVPKAVPLSHENILTNLRDVLQVVTIRESDRMLGFLPPFHSFGLTVTLLAPLLGGIRTVHHANPTEAWVLARLIETYKATLMLGTPTFLAGIVRAARGEQLASLRLAVTGAEKCPERTYAALRERCPGSKILEGYGVTECSPIVSVNCEEDAQPLTIGRVLPSVEYVIVDEEAGREVLVGTPGMLLVRGPSVFGGYLGQDAASPFVEFAGRQWYRTGDLVSADETGVLTFRGRLKRFVKLGGEMVSLPAIEALLEEHYVRDDDEGPVLAVAATPDEERPELVLFTVRPVERSEANARIRAAGLSALHNVSRVVQLESIPVLGTGKTDYRALREQLAGV